MKVITQRLVVLFFCLLLPCLPSCKNPDNANTYDYNQGTIKYKLGAYAEAIQDFTKAIELDPTDARAYNHRGVIKSKSEQLADAINDFTKAIELDSTDAMAYFNRGRAKAKLEDKTGARVDLKRASELGNQEANDMMKKLGLE